MVLDCHSRNPHLRHRQIQGLIQLAGHYLSPSSVYKVLREENRIENYSRRPSPLKTAKYEVIKSNMLWHEDWTKLLVNWTKWHFLAIIDAFSRKIVAWDIVPQVTSSDIKGIYKEALLNESLDNSVDLPKLRADRGSPNTSKFTQETFKELGAILSYASVRRPTENAKIERFFGTLKQEEFYLAKNYPDELTARENLEEYIDYYNNHRPHQGIWNFTPAYCHQVNNKTLLIKELEDLKKKSKELRLEIRGSYEDNQFIRNNLKIMRQLTQYVAQQ